MPFPNRKSFGKITEGKLDRQISTGRISYRYKDGQEVQTNARIKITRDCARSETYNLTLNLIKQDEAGDYEVKASNTMGTASTKSHVTVISKYQPEMLFLQYFRFTIIKAKANSI